MKRYLPFLQHSAQQKFSLKKLPPLQKWENDLNKSYPLKEWQIALQSTYKFSKCSNYWEIVIKITHRWHYIPYKLAKFCPNKSPNCWRNFGQVGNLLHILWGCPSLSRFWRQLFHLLASITGILSPPNVGLPNLSLVIDTYPTPMKQVVTHILLVARNTILEKWNFQDSPNISEVNTLTKHMRDC